MATLHERRERLAQCRARYAELIGEVALGGKPRCGRQQAEPDGGTETLDRLLERRRRVDPLEDCLERGTARASARSRHRIRRYSVDCPAVENRQEKVVVETDRYRVEGMLTLPREGYRSRVSDHVNRRDQEFFTILDAQLVALDGSGRDWATPVLMLARRHIRLIVPASEGA